MKTKTNIELDVVGQCPVNGRMFFICKLPAPKYQNDILYSYILVSTHWFEDPNAQWVEIVTPEVEGVIEEKALEPVEEPAPESNQEVTKTD